MKALKKKYLCQIRNCPLDDNIYSMIRCGKMGANGRLSDAQNFFSPHKVSGNMSLSSYIEPEKFKNIYGITRELVSDYPCNKSWNTRNLGFFLFTFGVLFVLLAGFLYVWYDRRREKRQKRIPSEIVE